MLSATHRAQTRGTGNWRRERKWNRAKRAEEVPRYVCSRSQPTHTRLQWFAGAFFFCEPDKEQEPERKLPPAVTTPSACKAHVHPVFTCSLEYIRGRLPS
jgi:hypothetical protein